MEQKNTELLAGYLIKIGIVAIIAFICWYFSSIVIYIAAAFVVSLIGKPIMAALKKLKIKGHRLPDWFLSIFVILLLMALLGFVVTQVIPVITGIIRDAAKFGDRSLPEGSLLDNINAWILSTIPSLGENFDAAELLLGKAKEIGAVSKVTGVIGSVASATTSVAIGLFSVVFISFFFLKDDQLFLKIATALAPEKYEEKTGKAISDIERLLSRYFVGLLIEMFGVALLDFLGLWLIVRIDAGYAIGIAFIAGILNIIPYVGPLIGEVTGTILCVILKYGTGMGLDVNIWIFALIVFAVMLATQMVDVFLYQPVIYSNSIQATPLEIFIVLLMAGTMGGMFGMLVAIPVYTVIRVIAGRFFYDKKIVKRLMPDMIGDD